MVTARPSSVCHHPKKSQGGQKAHRVFLFALLFYMEEARRGGEEGNVQMISSLITRISFLTKSIDLWAGGKHGGCGHTFHFHR